MEMMKDLQPPMAEELLRFCLGNFCAQHTILQKRKGKGMFTSETLPCGQGLSPWFEEAGGTALTQEASSLFPLVPLVSLQIFIWKSHIPRPFSKEAFRREMAAWLAGRCGG